MNLCILRLSYGSIRYSSKELTNIFMDEVVTCRISLIAVRIRNSIKYFNVFDFFKKKDR